MSLTVKHLNSDTSFLLTFHPAPPAFLPSATTPPPKTYTILLDPWLIGPSNIFHSKFSTSRHTTPPCITSLLELDEPELVIISQSKSDHCHKQTLTQLPASGGKTLILAEPAAAKVIRSWKYFAPEKVVTLPRFKGPDVENGKEAKGLHRISIPRSTENGGEDGEDGEVTIAYLAQKPDLTGLHNAIAITYRSPTTPSYNCKGLMETHSQATLPDTPPLTPASATSFASNSRPSSSNSLFSSPSVPRPLSLIYSPHGLPYKFLLPYITAHLLPLSALPLTALLHCFDSIQNAWYLGGNICSGFPGGLEIAKKLMAQVWISAHDGDKEIKGIANGGLEVRKYGRSEVESVVSPRSEKFPSNERVGTEAVVLGVGEEVVISGLGRGLRFQGGAERDVDVDEEAIEGGEVRRPLQLDFALGKLSPGSRSRSESEDTWVDGEGVEIGTPRIEFSVHD